MNNPLTDIRTPAAARLKLLRERAGLSMSDMARLMGYKTASGYQRLEDEASYPGPEFPLSIVRGLAAALIGRGRQPIDMRHIMPFVGLNNFSEADPLTLHRLFRLPVDELSRTRPSHSRGGAIKKYGEISKKWKSWDNDIYKIDDPRAVYLADKEEFIGIGPDIRFIDNDQVAYRIPDDDDDLQKLGRAYILCVTNIGVSNGPPVIISSRDLIVVQRIREDKYQISLRVGVMLSSVFPSEAPDTFILGSVTDENDRFASHIVAPFVLHTNQLYDEIDLDSGKVLGRVRILAKAIAEYAPYV